MLHDKNLNKIKQPLILIICKLDIFHLLCAADKIWITEFVIMSVKALSTDLIVFIGDVIMCFTLD
jgi:hypothetical protein